MRGSFGASNDGRKHTMNDYDAYDEEDYADGGNASTSDMLLHSFNEHPQPLEDWNDPAIQALPRILLMGPRRGGKTSIQVCFCLVQLKSILI